MIQLIDCVNLKGATIRVADLDEAEQQLFASLKDRGINIPTGSTDNELFSALIAATCCVCSCWQ